MSKTCTRCKSQKPIKYFGYRASAKDGKHFWCLDCVRQYNQDRRRDKPVREETRVCRYCLSDFMFYRKAGKGSNYKYCSDECSKKGAGWIRNRARRAKIKGAEVNENIDYSIVRQESNGCCEHCGDETPLHLRGTYDPKAPEVDHVIPISAGGHHAQYNVQNLCRSCNRHKGDSISPMDAEKVSKILRMHHRPEQVYARIQSNLNKTKATNTSGHKGVTWDNSAGKWSARITLPSGKRVRVGYFDSLNEAGKAVKEARSCYVV